VDGEYALADRGWRGQFETAGDQCQDFDICRFGAEEVGDCVEGKVGDGRETERAEAGLCGYGREDVGCDGVA